MFKEDEIFDLKIKSVLESGREEVPEQIWDRIQVRLDGSSVPAAPRRGRRILLWVRNAGIGTAVAAALVAAVVFSGLFDGRRSTEEMRQASLEIVRPRPENPSSADTGSTMIAQAVPRSDDMRDETSTRIPSDIVSAESAAQEYYTAAEQTGSSDTPEPEGDGSKETAGGFNPSETGIPEIQDIGSSAEESAGTWDDIFDDESESSSHKIRTALTISGNAISNANSERARDAAMMAPGSTVTTGITEDREGNTRYGIPVSAGVGVRLGFTPKWSMSIGLNYTFLTRTFDGVYTNADRIPAERTRYENIRNSQHYIGIPINFYYSILNKNFIDLYAYAGGAVDCCISNRYTADNTGVPPLAYSGKTGSLQLSANIGLGVEFLLGDYVGIYIDPSLRYYFRNSNAPKSIRTDQPLMLGFEAGLRFRL